MNEIQKYIIAHEPKMMNDLFSLIRIPSISALPEHHDDMLACAERWAQLLLEAGADEAVIKLKSLEAFEKAADGKATKIIIPSEIQNLAGLVTSIKEVAAQPEAVEEVDTTEK